MTSLDEVLDERVRRRAIETIRELEEGEFKAFVVKILGHLGLRVTAAAVTEGRVHVEAEGAEGAYLVIASREVEDHPALMRRLSEKARFEERLPVLMVTTELDEEERKLAEEMDISYADRSKLLLLLEKFDMEAELLREADRRVLEKEGSRYLPSIGRFDSLMQEAEAATKEGRYREALMKLERAGELKPRQEKVWKEKAKAFKGLGRLDEALTACEKAVDLQPNDPWAYYLMALVLHEMGDYQREVEAYGSALRLSPGMTAALLNKGATLHEMGGDEEALEVFENMIRTHPRDPRALNNRAIVLKSLGRLDEALSSLEKALSLDLENIDALINRAMLLSDMGRHSEAVGAWREAVAVDRRRPELWMALGESQRDAGMIEEAAKSFAVAATLAPDLEEAAVARDEALRMAGIDHIEGEGLREETLCRRYLDYSLLLEAVGEVEASLGEVEKCLELEPRSLEAARRRSHLLLDMGKLEEAISPLREALKGSRDPDLLLDLEALMYRMGRERECLDVLGRILDSEEARRRECLLMLDRGRAEKVLECAGDEEGWVEGCTRILALMITGRYREARGLIKVFLERYPHSPEMMNNLGVCLRFIGDLDGAERVLQEVVRQEPKYADAWNNLGCTFYVNGAFDEAEKCFRQALLVTTDPRYLNNLGTCLLSVEKIDEAQETFLSSLRLERSAEAINGLGIVAERKKEMVKALEFYEAALEKSPHFRDALKNRDRVRRLLGE